MTGGRSEAAMHSVEALRSAIEETDRDIVALIAHRLDLVHTLGAEKESPFQESIRTYASPLIVSHVSAVFC
jgi:chorismate mutase